MFKSIVSARLSIFLFSFKGGTTFGFMNGANFGSEYNPQPTSYDYDAPLSEAGDPRPKYFILQYIISKYVTLPAGPQPVTSQPVTSGKGSYGKFSSPKVSITKTFNHFSSCRTCSY